MMRFHIMATNDGLQPQSNAAKLQRVSMRSRLGIFAISALASGAIAVAVIASDGSSGPTALASAQAGHQGQPAPALVRSFAVLRRAHAATDAPPLPSAYARFVANNQFELDASAAQYAAVGSGVWVVPGTLGVCILLGGHDQGGDCGSTADAVAGRVYVVMLKSAPGTDPAASPETGETVYGLAPSTNATVTLSGGGASSTSTPSVSTVPVVSNVYTFQSATPVAVQLTTASGASVTLPHV
jgi:hypothetical protein